MQNQWSFRTKSRLKAIDNSVKVSQVIGKKNSSGNPFYPSFTDETVVLVTEDKRTYETTKASADGLGNLTFSKRGLADDGSDTEVAKFKRAWMPGTLMFVTLASQTIEAKADIDDLGAVAFSNDYNDLDNKLTAGANININSSNEISAVVVDDLVTESATSALSANQGYVLKGLIDDLSGFGKFLSLWDASTGQPISFPIQTPYSYSTGDYFVVETTSSATPPVNYRPTGSSYTGTASSTTESDELEVGDVYVYDGSVWLLQSNHGKTVTFSNIAGQPSDNANLATALNAKQDNLVAGTNITISASNEISAAGSILEVVTKLEYGMTPDTKYTDGVFYLLRDE